MKTKNQTSPKGRTVKVAGMNMKSSSCGLTIGLDLGDKSIPAVSLTPRERF